MHQPVKVSIANHTVARRSLLAGQPPQHDRHLSPGQQADEISFLFRTWNPSHPLCGCSTESSVAHNFCQVSVAGLICRAPPLLPVGFGVRALEKKLGVTVDVKASFSHVVKSQRTGKPISVRWGHAEAWRLPELGYTLGLVVGGWVGGQCDANPFFNPGPSFFNLSHVQPGSIFIFVVGVGLQHHSGVVDDRCHSRYGVYYDAAQDENRLSILLSEHWLIVPLRSYIGFLFQAREGWVVVWASVSLLEKGDSL